MLTSIRSAFEKGFMRFLLIALMGLLVISFAIWGIGDVLRTGNKNIVATVGSTQISLQEYQAQYQREMRLMAKQAQRPITEAELKQMGFDKLVLNKLVTDALLDEKVKALKLDINEQAVAERVRNGAIFKGASGKFDPSRFAEMMRDLGYNETEYLKLEKKLALRQHVASSVVGLTTAPSSVLNALHTYNTQSRVVQYVVVTSAQAGVLNAPKEEDLKNFYEQYKPLFTAPEYRAATVIAATPNVLKDALNIKDEELKANYERIKANLTTSEKRTFERVRFDSVEKANEAFKDGITFDAYVKAQNLTPEQIAFGTHEKAGMIDKAVADAGFALLKDGVSKPITTSFGTIVLRAKDIQASVTTPFDEIKNELRNEMVRERSRNVIYDIQDKIDKERASGLPLADIADKLKLSFSKIAAIDATGRDKNGISITLEGADLTVKEIFDAGINVEREPLQLKEQGGTVWVEVSAITPNRQKPLEEVLQEATSRYMEVQIATQLKAKAADIVKQVEGGKSLVEASGLTPVTSKPLTRYAQDAVWGQASLNNMFIAPKDKPATTSANDVVEQIVYIVKDIVNLPFDANSKDNIDLSKQLLKTYEDDMLTQFVASLRKEYKVSVDEVMFKRAAGGKAEN